MEAVSAQAVVAENVVLDGRLALFHRRERWLAVADLHYGYEVSQRSAGRLMPFWGMEPARERLLQLVECYAPEKLVLLGDLVHDAAAARQFAHLLDELRIRCEPVLIGGNHDRLLRRSMNLLTSWQTPGFHFHHGDCSVEATQRIQIIGHHHPAGVMRDGAGLRLKLPAFVQRENCWILPAFSPWAGGVPWKSDAQSRVWLCTPSRILRLPHEQPARVS